MLDFMVLAQECAPTVAPQTMLAVVQVESGINPYAIGVVGGRLERQPQSQAEAVATAKALEAEGWNFSVGVAQVNRYNLTKYSLTYEQAFEPCANMRVGSQILEECYMRALPATDGDRQRALHSALSCYYSGNFTRGFRPDKAGEPSYVQKVLARANIEVNPIPVVPAVTASTTDAQREAAAPTPSAPSKHQPQATNESPPVDHAPVLLRRDDAAAAPVRPEETAPEDEVQAAPTQSVIVF